MNTSPQLEERRGGGVWDYVSPSRVNLWLKCPLAFRLRYVEGIPSSTSASQFLGKVVHRALEVYYRQRQQSIRLGTEEVASRLKEQWDEAVHCERVEFVSATQERAARDQSIDLVRAYLAQVAADEPRPLAVETMLEAPLRNPVTGEDFGIPLVGIIDLVLPGADGAVVTDFKTTSRGGMLEITHELQLSAYSFLFRQSSPLPEEALEIRSLVKTKQPRIENYRFPARMQTHYARLFAVIRGYLDALDSGTYVIRPGHLCAACEYRHTRCAHWTG